MRSKNKTPPTPAERKHVQRVKLLPCSVCDVGGGYGAPSEAHEIKQGAYFTTVALCADCHRGSGLGFRAGMWRLKKMDELDALGVTLARLFDELERERIGI